MVKFVGIKIPSSTVVSHENKFPIEIFVDII